VEGSLESQHSTPGSFFFPPLMASSLPKVSAAALLAAEPVEYNKPVAQVSVLFRLDSLLSLQGVSSTCWRAYGIDREFFLAHGVCSNLYSDDCPLFVSLLNAAKNRYVPFFFLFEKAKFISHEYYRSPFLPLQQNQHGRRNPRNLPTNAYRWPFRHSLGSHPGRDVCPNRRHARVHHHRDRSTVQQTEEVRLVVVLVCFEHSHVPQPHRRLAVVWLTHDERFTSVLFWSPLPEQ